MAVLYTNNASTLLTASITNAATSFSVTAGTGSLFPVVSGSDYFYITLVDNAGNYEIVKVTGRSTDTFTITRGQDGTSARAFSVGDKVELRIVRAMLDDLKGERLPLTGGTLSGILNISPNFGTNTSTVDFGAVVKFDNSYSDGARGPNKVVLYNDVGSWLSGLGIHNNTLAVYSGGVTTFYSGTTGYNAVGTATLSFDASSISYKGNALLHAGNYTDYAAPASHTHSYLPLSGGALSGGITLGSFLKIATDNSDWGTGNYFRGASDHFVLGVQSGGTLYLNYGNEAGTTRISGTTLVNGNQVLHAGNYSSYAAPASHTHSYLPLSGGTLASGVDGILTLNKTAGSAWNYIGFSVAGTRRFYFGLNASYEPELGTDNGGMFRVLGPMTVQGWQAMTAATMDLSRNIVSGTNLDTDLEGGGAYWSYGAGGTSWNSPFNYGGVVAFAGTSGIRAQLGFDNRHNNSNYADLWYRAKNNLGYTNWQKMLHSGNYTDYTDGRYVLKTGDTMTGTLQFNAITNSLIAQHDGSSTDWRGRIISRNSDINRAVFLGNYNGKAGLFAHTNALDGWAPLYLNTLGSNGGYNVYLPHNATYTMDGGNNTYPILNSGNYTDYFRYNTWDDWLRDKNDDQQFKLYGNTRTVIFRTDGATNDHGGGAYAYIWYYGSSNDSERRMILNTNGNLWTNSYGWLHDAFAPMSHDHDARYLPSQTANTGFTVGGSNTTFYPVVLSCSSYYTNGWNQGFDFEIFRDDVHENFTSAGTFRLRVFAQPSDWGHRPGSVMRVEYKPGYGTYADAVGDVTPGHSYEGYIIVWLRGGMTYHLKSLGWNYVTCVNANSSGASSISTSYGTFTSITSQGSVITAAKNGMALYGYPVLTGGNYSSYALPLSGGTMSGTITMGGNYINNAGQFNLNNGFTISQGGANYGQFSSWVHLPGYHGLYSTNNGAHFYPNDADYGAWRINGSRGGWNGLYFDTGSTLMMNSSEVGFHRSGYGWQMWWSGGTGYVHKGSPGGGTQATILDSSNYTNYAASASHDHSRITWVGNRTAETGATYNTPSGYFEVVGSYNNGWPNTYGNVLSVNGGGAGQLFMGWIGGSGAETGELYYRSMTDWRTNWGSWRRVLTNANWSEYAAPASHSHSWPSITSGYREDYDLGIRPPNDSWSYAGFRFATPGNDANAGYLLIRGGPDSDVYTQNGITLVADAGWLTLAQRNGTDKGVRLMTNGTTRLSVNYSGDIAFVNGNSINYNSGRMVYGDSYAGDENYNTGSIGRSGVNIDDIFQRRSGFIDVWAGGGAQPFGGTSHVTGFQSMHYWNGTTGYGLQVVGNHENRSSLKFRLRSSNGINPWYDIIHSGNYTSYSDGRYVLKSGDTMTGTLKINTTGSGSASSHFIIKRSGASEPGSFGAYDGSWRSSIEVWNNDTTKMLFMNPPENNFGYSILKSVNGGMVLDVGSNGGTRVLIIEAGGNSRFTSSLSVGASWTDTTFGVAGESHFTNAIYLDTGNTLGNKNTWSGRLYSTGGTTYINTNQFEVNRYGYGAASPALFFVNTSGGSINGNTILHAGNFTDYPSQRIVSNYQEWDFSWGSHSTTPMSISLWDNYQQSGAPSSYGTLLDIYGMSGHQHDQLYFYQGNLIHRYGWYGNNNWNSWQTILTSNNYSNYALPLSGGTMTSWLKFSADVGLRSDTNSAYLYANNASYGAYRIAGSRNGWNGIEFDGSSTQVSLMIEANGNTVGWHANSYGWKFRVDGGTAYVYKSFWGGGTEAVVLDSSNYTNYVTSAPTAFNVIGSVAFLYRSSGGSFSSIAHGGTTPGSVLFYCSSASTGSGYYGFMSNISVGSTSSQVGRTTAFSAYNGSGTYSPIGGTWRALSVVTPAQFNGYDQTTFPGGLYVRIS